MINRILSMEVAPSEMSISYINDLNIGNSNSMVTLIQLNGPKKEKKNVDRLLMTTNKKFLDYNTHGSKRCSSEVENMYLVH